MSNTNTLLNTAFRNSNNLSCYATLKYAKIAPEIVSSLPRLKTLSNQAILMQLFMQLSNKQSEKYVDYISVLYIYIYTWIIYQTEFHLVHNQKGSCDFDHIPFNLKGIRDLFLPA